jgi:hypothetical protein
VLKSEIKHNVETQFKKEKEKKYNLNHAYSDSSRQSSLGHASILLEEEKTLGVFIIFHSSFTLQFNPRF